MLKRILLGLAFVLVAGAARAQVDEIADVIYEINDPPSVPQLSIFENLVLVGTEPVLNFTTGGGLCTVTAGIRVTCDLTSLGGGGGAPTTAHYLTDRAEAGLSAEQNIGALTTGLMLNSVSGGVGTVSAYAGGSCTNQFFRSVNASGAPTCASIAMADFASMAANTVVLNATAGAAAPTAFAMPACADSGGNHLNYVGGTGFTCGTSSSGGAPTDAHYVTTTAEAGLSAEANLGALTTGLVLNTVAAGTSTLSTFSPTASCNGFIKALDASGAATCSATVSSGSLITSAGNIQVGGASAFIQSGGSGSSWQEGVSTEILTLSTGGLTTDTTANLLPSNSEIMGVVVRIQTTITTTTNWAVGDATTSDHFCSPNATLTSGTTAVCLNHRDAGYATTSAKGAVNTSAQKVRITCTGANPGAGSIKIFVYWRQWIPPAS